MSTSSSPLFKRAKIDSTEKSDKIIGTHSGTFQADEAMGVWMLRQLPEYRNSKVIRTRDPNVYDKLDIVIDVGGVYDHAKLRYDHHQRGYDERFDYDLDGEKQSKRCTKLSASGLVYRHYGEQIIQRYYPELTDEYYLNLAYVKIYNKLLEALDAIDTGVEPVAAAGDTNTELLYKDSTGLSTRVSRLNIRWNEEIDYDDNNSKKNEEDTRFEQAVTMCGEDFVSVMTSVIESDLPARQFVEMAIEERKTIDPSGEIICFKSGGMPWKQHLYELEKQHGIVDDNKLIKFVLYQDTAGMWRVQAVTVEGKGFENRVSLPEAWRGVRDEDLVGVTSIPGSRFCHAAGFIGGNDTYEGALQMAQVALATTTKTSAIDGSTTTNGNGPVERFVVDYVIQATDEETARKLAWDICLEQTVELPGQVVPVKEVEDYVVGKIEHVEEMSCSGSSSSNKRIFKVSIAYPNETAGGELTQFLNVVFGNTSLKPDIAVDNVVLSKTLSEDTNIFPGPRYGIEGLRKLLGVPKAPLLCTALKPMGKSSKDFAEMAYKLARGGIDIIKDDHGLADQSWSPYEERVKLCSEAVKKAISETGRNCLYAPCLNAPASLIKSRAYYAKNAGAGAVMMLPGINGFDSVRELAADKNFGLPILIHPALLGGWIQANHYLEGDDNGAEASVGGISHQFLFGDLPRLVGGDTVIFPNAGGRFSFSKQECQAIVDGCRRPLGRFAPIFPCPAGGMKLHRVGEMRETFSDDTLFLIGGALLEEGTDLEVAARKFATSAGRGKEKK